MAREQAVWGIEIGQSALKALRLEKKEDGSVEATAFEYVEHPKILSQPDADAAELARAALRTFLSRNDVSNDRVVIGIPGQNGLIRFVKLPPVEPSKIPDLIQFEARQQIPFPLEEVIWDYQPISGPGGNGQGFAGQQQEVGLFAMKRDILYGHIAPYLEADIEFDVVQLRPLAVYNFAAYDLLGYPEQSGPSEDGYIVVMEMGADNTDLVITDGLRVWQRTLTIGGNHFTRALTKELKLTFAKAEHLKRNATKAQDPRVLFQTMRPVFNDFVNEVQRSLGFFASVHRRAKIARVVGVGNAFKLPGLQKLLAQQLKLPVERLESFHRLGGASVVESPVFRDNLPGFAVAYGLALQGLGLAPIRGNLIPKEIVQRRLIRAKKPWVLTAAAALLTAYTLVFFGNWSRYHAVAEARYGEAERDAKAAIDLANQYKRDFETAKNKWQQVKNQGEALTANVRNRYLWLELLQTLTAELPDPGVQDLRKVPDRKDLLIDSIDTQYFTNLAEWYQGIDFNDPEVKLTAFGLDRDNPPNGEGWVLFIRGHHFNRFTETHTYQVLWKLQESARLRQLGVTHITLTANETTLWNPSENPPTLRRASSSGTLASRGSGGALGSMGSMTSGNLGYGASDRGMMSANPGGYGMSGYGYGGGGEDYATGGLGGGMPGMGGMMGGMPPSGTSGAPATGRPAAQQQQLTNVVRLPRTDFIIEFAWKPTPSDSRKNLAEVAKEIQDYLKAHPRPRPRAIRQEEVQQERQQQQQQLQQQQNQQQQPPTGVQPSAPQSAPGQGPAPGGQPAPSSTGTAPAAGGQPTGQPGAAPNQPQR